MESPSVFDHKRLKYTALIPAFYYCLYLGYSLYTTIKQMTGNSEHIFPYIRIPFFVIIAGMAVSYFCTSNRFASVFTAAFTSLTLWDMVSSLAASRESSFPYYQFLYVLAYVALTVLAVLSSVRVKAVRKIWFVPGAAMLLYYCLVWILKDAFAYFSGTWLAILLGLLETVAVFGAGLWLASAVVEVKAKESADESSAENKPRLYIPKREKPPKKEKTPEGKTSPAPKYVPPSKRKPEAVTDEQAIMTSLRSYKEMLDAGLITQEDYDKKKSQLLGL